MKRSHIILMGCLLILLNNLAVCNVYAEQKKYKDITAPEVKAMLDEGKTLVIHVLSEIEYNVQHISGSINIPITDMKTTDKLPKDKNIPLIFYCMGVK